MFAFIKNSCDNKVNKSKLAIQKRNLEYFLEKSQLSTIQKENLLIDQLKHISSNLESSLKKRNLAKKALSEITKLYQKGRAGIDQVLRAEESLINTERGFVNFISQREKINYQLAALYGELKGFVLQ